MDSDTKPRIAQFISQVALNPITERNPMYIRPLKYSIPTLLFAACTSTGNSAPNETWKVNAD